MCLWIGGGRHRCLPEPAPNGTRRAEAVRQVDKLFALDDLKRIG
jgi:hypothetical protein